jgi:spore coat polysaccharide biosynthesis protein SpsF (cytidylyltransferase family)/aryl-alcohol dehydrogenase-like predicted oxidoreductase
MTPGSAPLQPSRVALGTAQFGLDYGVSNITGRVALKDAAAMLDYARRARIDTLDTAIAYGAAETRLGELGVRDFHIVTKLLPLADGRTVEPGHVEAQVSASLKRLGVDRLYGLLVHRPQDLAGAGGAELGRQILALKSAGVVVKVGVSIYSPSDLEAIEKVLPVDLVQAPMNVFDRRLESSGALDRLHQRNIEVHARSVFLQGLLIMPPKKIPEKFAPWRKDLERWHEWHNSAGLTAVEACVSHVAGYPRVSRFVVGCENVGQLEEIVRAFDKPPRPAPTIYTDRDERLIHPTMWSDLGKTLAIIQARLGSSRLPGKVLSDLHGRPMLAWLLERVKSVKAIDEIVVATTTEAKDDKLEQWIREHGGVDCFRGSERDVLDRFYHCAEGRGADLIVRVTADDPLKDPSIIARAISICRDDPTLDYCSNTMIPTYPEGLDIEVFRTEALARAQREAVLASDREHVTPYIWNNPDKFRLKNFEYERNLSTWRWTVDRPADLDLVRAILTHFPGRPLVPFTDIIALLERKPELMQINAGIVRGEGYLKSLQEENQ